MDVSDVKHIKLIINDNQMPSSKPEFNEFGLDWQNDWEVEISKVGFATAFGNKIQPTEGDLVYIPMMKRMWEVNSAYDEKNEGLMWRSTTWKLALVKYTESTNVDPSEYDNIIDSWVQHYEDVFGEIEKNEQEPDLIAAFRNKKKEDLKPQVSESVKVNNVDSKAKETGRGMLCYYCFV